MKETRANMPKTVAQDDRYNHADQELRRFDIARLGPRLERLLQAANVYVYTVVYAQNTVVATTHSQGCQATTGYSPRDYDRDPLLWIDMVHPDDRDEVCQRVFEAENASHPTQFEHRINHRNGSTRWVRNTIIPSRVGNQLMRCDGLVEDITERKLAERSLMHHEIQLAAAQEIQRRLLPQTSPAVRGTEIAGGLFPAQFAAGDFYDYLTLPDGAAAFVIGDVSGHGFGPALLMSLTHTLVRILADIESDIETILAQINNFLVKETQDDRFVTLFFARYEVQTRTFTYASAGHPPAYVVDRNGNLKTRLLSTSFPLGVVPDAQFPVTAEIALAPGDVVLMLTDGTFETLSPEKIPFGEQRTIQLLQDHRDLTAPKIIEALRTTLADFSQRNAPADDITAVVLKIN